MKKILMIPFYFIIHYFPNHVISKIPFYFIRNFYYRRVMNIKIGKGSSIHLGVFINKSRLKSKIEIGNNSTINRNCYIDGRGDIKIGSNVSISPEVNILTADHDINTSDFKYKSAPVILNDFVWVGTRAIILPGITIEEGAVIAAGSVVTKDVPPYAIVGGVPAKIIRYRFSNVECENLENLKWWDKEIEWIKKHFKEFLDVEIFVNNQL